MRDSRPPHHNNSNSKRPVVWHIAATAAASIAVRPKAQPSLGEGGGGAAGTATPAPLPPEDGKNGEDIENDDPTYKEMWTSISLQQTMNLEPLCTEGPRLSSGEILKKGGGSGVRNILEHSEEDLLHDIDEEADTASIEFGSGTHLSERRPSLRGSFPSALFIEEPGEETPQKNSSASAENLTREKGAGAGGRELGVETGGSGGAGLLLRRTISASAVVARPELTSAGEAGAAAAASPNLLAGHKHLAQFSLSRPPERQHSQKRLRAATAASPLVHMGPLERSVRQSLGAGAAALTEEATPVAELPLRRTIMIPEGTAEEGSTAGATSNSTPPSSSGRSSFFHLFKRRSRKRHDEALEKLSQAVPVNLELPTPPDPARACADHSRPLTSGMSASPVSESPSHSPFKIAQLESSPTEEKGGIKVKPIITKYWRSRDFIYHHHHKRTPSLNHANSSDLLAVPGTTPLSLSPISTATPAPSSERIILRDGSTISVLHLNRKNTPTNDHSITSLTSELKKVSGIMSTDSAATSTKDDTTSNTVREEGGALCLDDGETPFSQVSLKTEVDGGSGAAAPDPVLLKSLYTIDFDEADGVDWNDASSSTPAPPLLGASSSPKRTEEGDGFARPFSGLSWLRWGRRHHSHSGLSTPPCLPVTPFEKYAVESSQQDLRHPKAGAQALPDGDVSSAVISRKSGGLWAPLLSVFSAGRTKEAGREQVNESKDEAPGARRASSYMNETKLPAFPSISATSEEPGVVTVSDQGHDETKRRWFSGKKSVSKGSGKGGGKLSVLISSFTSHNKPVADEEEMAPAATTPVATAEQQQLSAELLITTPPPPSSRKPRGAGAKHSGGGVSKVKEVAITSAEGTGDGTVITVIKDSSTTKGSAPATSSMWRLFGKT